MWVRCSLVLLLAVVFLPAAALAQSAGDEQYQDPFGGKDPKPAATTAPTYQAPVATAVPTYVPTYVPTAVPTEDPAILERAIRKNARKVGSAARTPVPTATASAAATTTATTAPASSTSSGGDSGGGGTTVGIVIIVAALLVGSGVFFVRRNGRGESVPEA